MGNSVFKIPFQSHEIQDDIMEAVKNVLHKIHLGGDEKEAAREPSPAELQELKDKYTKAKQEQVFAFYDELSVAEKAALFEQLSSFDPDHINTITDRALNPPAQTKDADKESGLEPLPDSTTASILVSRIIFTNPIPYSRYHFNLTKSKTTSWKLSRTSCTRSTLEGMKRKPLENQVLRNFKN